MDFNSSMVRLRLEYSTLDGQEIYTFQFHNGTIKVGMERIGECDVFISIPLRYGSIKGEFKYLLNATENLFQFHD